MVCVQCPRAGAFATNQSFGQHKRWMKCGGLLIAAHLQKPSKKHLLGVLNKKAWKKSGGKPDLNEAEVEAQDAEVEEAMEEAGPAQEPVPEPETAFLFTGTEAWDALAKCSHPSGLTSDVVDTINKAAIVVQPSESTIEECKAKGCCFIRSRVATVKGAIQDLPIQGRHAVAQNVHPNGNFA
eukprot:2468146-Rhodomonas_salina.1